MSAAPPSGLSGFETIVEEINVFRYTAVATMTVFIYDYLSTLHEEVYLVWLSRWSFIKMIYFLNRAVAFVASFLLIHLLLVISDEKLCMPNLYATVLMAQMTFVIGEIVLFMRVYAIWFCSRRMLALLVAVYVPGVVASTYATVHATSSALTLTLPEIVGAGCVLSYTNTDFWICYLVLLFHETFMLSLILTKAFLSSGYSLSNLLRIVVKDGIMYYFCVLGTSVANLLVLLLTTKNLRIFLILTQGVIHSILCARLLLRLRGAYKSLTAEGLRAVRVRSETMSSTLVDEDEARYGIPLQTFSVSTN